MDLLYMEVAKIIIRQYYKVLLLAGFCLLAGCTSNLEEVPLVVNHENPAIATLDFSQMAKDIEWDTLRIIVPYSDIEELPIKTWNMREVKNLTKTDIHVLVVYTSIDEITGYSLVPRRFELLNESNQTTSPKLKYAKANSKFVFKKVGDSYTIISQ